MFRGLGLHPANDISTGAAAAIVGLPVTQAKQVLDQLLDAHMVEQRRPNRYELYDLCVQDFHRVEGGVVRMATSGIEVCCG